MQNFSLFNNVIQCPKMVNCLYLCGYSEPSDFRNFNSDSLFDIQNYVKAICKNIPREHRTEYLDDYFIDNPEDFVIKPSLKKKLLQAAGQFESMVDLMGMCSSNLPNNLELVEHEVPPQSTMIIEEIVEVSDDEMLVESGIQKDNNVESEHITEQPISQWIDSSDKLMNEIVEKADLTFENCNLTPRDDFNVIINSSSFDLANFQCKICQKSNPKNSMTVFKLIIKNDSVDFNKIKTHLKKHFKILPKKFETDNKENAEITETDVTDKEILEPRRRGRRPKQPSLKILLNESSKFKTPALPAQNDKNSGKRIKIVKEPTRKSARRSIVTE